VDRLGPHREPGEPVGLEPHDVVVLVQASAFGVPYGGGMGHHRRHARGCHSLDLGTRAGVAPEPGAPVRDPQHVTLLRRGFSPGEESFRRRDHSRSLRLQERRRPPGDDLAVPELIRIAIDDSRLVMPAEHEFCSRQRPLGELGQY
jgi:hypothetical protein